MLQQTAAEKHHSRLSFLDGFSAGRKEHEANINYLKEDYSAAIRLAANLHSHAKWIPYPFLVNRLKNVAEEVRAQAEVIRQKIVELGGNLPQVAIHDLEDAEFRQNVKRLVKDMEEYAALTEVLVHQKNNVHDEAVLKILGTVAANMQRQKDELMDIVMRLS
jgi:hypothetical protein